MDYQVTLAVQAGGLSSRMGENKAYKLFRGQPLIQRVLERLAPLADEILITTRQPQAFSELGARAVVDVVPGCGALGGLYTGIALASYPIVAVAACDLPFANLDLFRLAIRLLVIEDVDVVIPLLSGGLEPLHAVYRRETCLPVIHSALEAGHLKATGWFSSVRVRTLTEKEIYSVDPSGLAFLNTNTPEEFAAAERLTHQL